MLVSRGRTVEKSSHVVNSVDLVTFVFASKIKFYRKRLLHTRNVKFVQTVEIGINLLFTVFLII